MLTLLFVCIQVRKQRNKQPRLPDNDSTTRSVQEGTGDAPDHFDGPMFDDADDIPYGERERGGGRSSLFQEFPERMRAGSEDSGQGPEIRINKSRRSSDVQSLQSKFDFDQSPRCSSVVSQRSRLVSVGEVDFGNSLLGLEIEEDESIFKDQSLQEEPETQTQNQGASNKVEINFAFSWIFLLLSCWIASQRLSNNDLHVARCIANELSQADQGTLSFFHLIGSKATPQQAARVFYSMLALQNDNIVCLEQDEPYSDIMIGSTANTAMYAYCPA